MATKSRQLTIFIDGEPYYAAQKAEEVLDMSYSGLKYQVSIGNIKAEVPKGRRQSYYKVKDVEQVARDLKAYSIIRKKRTVNFTIVSDREDMIKCLEVSKMLFGSERGDIEKHMRIINKNPETYYMLKDENQIVGYTAIWPVKAGKIDSLLAQTIPVKISPEDIETFEEGKEIDLYINVIGIKPGFSMEERRFYGSRLISGLIGAIVNMGERGILINKIGARSNMPDGIRLMKGIGFTEIEPLTPERRTFIINIKESGIPFVLQYKEALRKNTELEKGPMQLTEHTYIMDTTASQEEQPSKAKSRSKGSSPSNKNKDTINLEQ